MAKGSGVTIGADCSEVGGSDPVKKTDFGAMVGAGLDFSMAPKTSLVVELFYDLGLATIDDTGDDLKNRAFSILAGLSFKLGL